MAAGYQRDSGLPNPLRSVGQIRIQLSVPSALRPASISVGIAPIRESADDCRNNDAYWRSAKDG